MAIVHLHDGCKKFVDINERSQIDTANIQAKQKQTPPAPKQSKTKTKSKQTGVSVILTLRQNNTGKRIFFNISNTLSDIFKPYIKYTIEIQLSRTQYIGRTISLYIIQPVISTRKTSRYASVNSCIFYQLCHMEIRVFLKKLILNIKTYNRNFTI